jgi:GT2 family glycosyltransferase
MSHFEVYILNYNGERYLKNCLTALQQIDKGGNTVVFNLVDNGFVDGSEKLRIPELVQSLNEALRWKKICVTRLGGTHE